MQKSTENVFKSPIIVLEKKIRDKESNAGVKI